MLASALLVTILCLSVSNIDASRKRPRPQRDTILPKPQQVTDHTTIRVVADGITTTLIVRGNPNEAATVLKRLFRKLNVSFSQNDKTSHTIITGWIRFIYDPETNKVYYKKRSRHPLERHRFRISIKPATQTGKTLIVVQDHKRQLEVDLAPDSMASFLEWRHRPVQPGAALAFARYLQGRYGFTSMAVLKRMPVTNLQPGKTRQKNIIIKLAKKPPVVSKKKPATKDRSEKTNNSNPGITTSRTVKKTAPAPKLKSATNSATSPMGLEVTAPVETVWQALQQGLKKNMITYKVLSNQPYTLKTDWLHYSWNKKTKILLDQSKTGPQWSHKTGNLKKQQHQFIITVSPGVNKAVSFIGATHAGHQEYIDAWPDSTASFFQWKNKSLQPIIAEAFLQHLNLGLK